MQYVCGGCSAVWGTWLTACPRCRAALHSFGSTDSDYDLPVMARFPLGRLRGRVIANVPTVLAMPRVRDSVDLWRQWASAQGQRPEDVASMTKADLINLYRPDEADDDDDPLLVVA